MRDHRRLRAYELADELALRTYRVTRGFPSEERFGLVSQMRRAAVSTASNIVEGCGRSSNADYLRFLDMANGSARELAYQLSLAERLDFIPNAELQPFKELAEETNRVLAALIRALRKKESGS